VFDAVMRLHSEKAGIALNPATNCACPCTECKDFDESCNGKDQWI